ncbi:MAG: hypothetical protein R3D30_08335 [Hyphomicrobiales bacterium]
MIFIVLNPNARNKDKQHIATDITRLLNLFREIISTRASGPMANRRYPMRLTETHGIYVAAVPPQQAAWYIANRPFGSVAGKIQYKHASLAMFEGYAGASRSGFRSETKASANSASSMISSPTMRTLVTALAGRLAGGASVRRV